MKKTLPAVLAMFMSCAFTLNLCAQNFSLLKDVNTSKDGNPFNDVLNLYIGWKNNIFFYGNVGYSKYAVLTGVAYFAADDGIHGTEIWRSDGTSAGTYMLKDINAGETSSQIQSIVVAGNRIFFTANRIVYVSDGTETGTVPVPGITYTTDVTTYLTPVGNMLYFFTDVSKLWKTDGTAAGTALVIDFREAYTYTKDFLGQLTNVNGTLYFTTGQDYANGVELWKSNGTAAGTMMVKDINPGVPDSRPLNLTAVNDKLYFSADDGTGAHLWVSDGTENGTQPVINKTGAAIQQTDINGNLDIAPLAVVDTVLYFKASTPATGYELYKYDIAKPAAGVSLVKDVIEGALGSNPANITAVNNALYFSVSDASGDQQLWKSNGQKAGTKLIKSLGAGIPKNLSGFTNVNGKLLFSFFNINTGYELWRSDGTAGNTSIVKDIYGGNHSSMPGGITYLKNNIALFNANDGVQGNELWITNTETSGTAPVKNINNTTTAGFGPDLHTSVFFNNKLIFNGYTPGYGSNVYTSDGTAAGTQLLKDINFGNSSNPSNFTIFKNKVYFAADSAGYKAIYKTDGTTSGTSKVFVFNRPNAGVPAIAAGENFLYVFFIDLDSVNVHLWSSNGTAAGSHEIQMLSSQSGYNSVSVIGNTLYFSEFDSTHGMELWKANNTPGSAKMVKDIFPGFDNSYPNNFVTFNGKLYFTAGDSLYTTFIYVSDGTKAGTKRIIQGRGPITTLKDKLFFTGYNMGAGDELFISDGTTAGTTLLKDIIEGQASSYPYEFTVINNTIYFTAASDIYGYELWKTDGTTKGTVLVKDIIPGESGSSPYGFIAAGDKLYFRAANEFYQAGLFVSNGKAAGTKQVVDAGLDNVTINSFTGGGDKLFIGGYTYALGNELYAGNAGVAPVINNVTAKKMAEKKALSATVLGNPVQHELNLSIQSAKGQKANIIITDASGKVLVNNSALLNAGKSNITYPAGAWASGIYTVMITADDGSPAVLKIVK